MMDPYKSGVFEKSPYAEKRLCSGNLVAILDGRMEKRELQLLKQISRVVRAGEIHELILTDEDEAAPGMEVNRISYLGFFEVVKGTVIVTGDRLIIGNKNLGTIAGFDETHMPNHLNIIVKAKERLTGVELGLALEDEVLISIKEECVNG
ncbi:MAG: hypothetical protein QHH10_12405 [Peptococcaceae bacterium]|nr:hypothetical protein [Peptococcaceae bacterium]MDH7526105.1 hypothetical protein [Peptococcaceae bacterium]